MQSIMIMAGLLVWAILGLAGSFAGTGPARNVLWAVSGIGLVVASLLLAIRFARRSRDEVAAGFAILAIAEAVLFSGIAAAEAASQAILAAGWGLYVPGLLLVSLPSAVAIWVRGVGVVASLPFAVASLQILVGQPVSPDSPLLSAGYALFTVTAVGWIVAVARERGTAGSPRPVTVASG